MSESNSLGQVDTNSEVQLTHVRAPCGPAEIGILSVIASLLDFIPSFSLTVLHISRGSNSLTNHWHMNPHLKVSF